MLFLNPLKAHIRNTVTAGMLLLMWVCVQKAELREVDVLLCQDYDVLRRSPAQWLCLSVQASSPYKTLLDGINQYIFTNRSSLRKNYRCFKYKIHFHTLPFPKVCYIIGRQHEFISCIYAYDDLCVGWRSSVERTEDQQKRYLDEELAGRAFGSQLLDSEPMPSLQSPASSDLSSICSLACSNSPLMSLMGFCPG